MASVHIEQIQQWLADRGDVDALPGPVGMFVEIRFDRGGARPAAIDEDFAGKVLTVDSPQGIVTISFDESGQLQSLDIS